MKRVGIDIGGTQLRVAIFDEQNEILSVEKFSNELSTPPAESCQPLIDFINDNKEHYQFNSVGIGAPGPLNLRLGRIVNPPNLPSWWNFDIVRHFEDATGVKTSLNNDANIAGLAEAVHGAGRGYESVFFIGMSTGVGGAYVVDQKIVEGANSMTAEIWNMPVSFDTYKRHDDVNPGSLNETCSGSAIARMGTEIAGRAVSSKEVFDLAQAGDSAMSELLDSVVNNMARGIAIISAVVDPEIFVIGGSVALHNPWLLPRIQDVADPMVLAPKFLRIRLARYGDDAGLLGASLL